MSRETDKKIAERCGWSISLSNNRFDAPYMKKDGYFTCAVPYYSTSDSDAITLLPVLVEMGYYPTLDYQYDKKWSLEIWKPLDTNTSQRFEISVTGCADTIAEAVTSTILALIEKEVTK